LEADGQGRRRVATEEVSGAVERVPKIACAQITRFTFGSKKERRRHDEHVHAPSSVGRNYAGTDDEPWEAFLLDREALPPELKNTGINDYMFIHGYERVRKAKLEQGRLRNIDLISPVIELRLDEFAGSVKKDMHRAYSSPGGAPEERSKRVAVANATSHARLKTPTMVDRSRSSATMRWKNCRKRKPGRTTRKRKKAGNAMFILAIHRHGRAWPGNGHSFRLRP
jgi:hypothetical protein